MWGGLLASGEDGLANGDVEACMVMVAGLAHMLNADPAAEARRRRLRRRRRRLLGSDSDDEGSDLRGAMMSMVGKAIEALPPSMSSIDWMAQTAATVVDSPTAVSGGTREGTFGVLGALVGQVNATEAASMAPSAAASVTHGLNSLMLSMAQSHSTTRRTRRRRGSRTRTTRRQRARRRRASRHRRWASSTTSPARW